MLHETEMGGYFQRQLAVYVEYHRDPRNTAMHVVGILLLFTGAVMPLTLVRLPLFGFDVSLAVILALPVLIYWLLLDVALGIGILAVSIVLFFRCDDRCGASRHRDDVGDFRRPGGARPRRAGHRSQGF
ncbi:Mpo1-like protein [Bradyrhizobium ottawaense]|uniref:Mpo1-like protein n=1 Tax=Bradyrhizobium ottawaense TaxID=931866 RepID=UPI00339B2A71